MSAKGGLIASVALLVLAPVVDAGGWAIVTMRDVPDWSPENQSH